MKSHSAIVLGLSLAFFHLALSSSCAEILVKSGEKIAFMGDSITGQGWGNPVGYVHLVMAGLEANGVKAEAVPRGVSGHKSDQMLARLQKDVISRKPQWMTLSCGVNDVWHRAKGVPLDDAMAANGTYDANVASRGTFKKNITEIVDKATAANIKVVILTATGIKEQLDNKENTQLVPYNEFLRHLARERKIPLADLNAVFREKIQAANTNKNVLTVDGVHMKAEGNKVMATGVLKAFGLNDAELAKANEAWTPMIEKDAAEHQAKARAAAECRAKAAAEKKAQKKASDGGAAKSATPAPPAK